MLRDYFISHARQGFLSTNQDFCQPNVLSVIQVMAKKNWWSKEAPHPEHLDRRKRKPKVPSWLSVDWGATQGEKEGIPFREQVHIKPLEIENPRLKSAF